MRNIKCTIGLLICVVFTSFSQSKTIQKGTYLSISKGEKLKLKLLENNQFDLVFYSGDYLVKGDSIFLNQNKKNESGFNVVFKGDKQTDKVKIKFLETAYNSFYVGTQNGTEAIKYINILDLKEPNDDGSNNDVEFNIDRADYLYLVYEGLEKKSQVSKFVLPKDVSEVTVVYQLDNLGDFKIKGKFDKNTGNLILSDSSSKNPLMFKNETAIQTDTVVKIKPIENNMIANWTFAGKESFVQENDEIIATDSIDSEIVQPKSSTYDFKIKTENNLKAAIEATKNAKNKFLVVNVDSKNPYAKADFDSFIEEKQMAVGYYMESEYYPQYDIFNYYLATDNDKKWLKSAKITGSPNLIIINGDGTILATCQSTLSNKKEDFNYYTDLSLTLKKKNSTYLFNKAINNKKILDQDVIAAFNAVALLDGANDFTTPDTFSDEVKDKVNFIDVSLNEKEINQVWKKLIDAHQKDTKPNPLLVQTIIKEINNEGFNKHLFNNEKVLNDTDFKAIDYLIKHYDAIEESKLSPDSQVGFVDSLGVSMMHLNTEIAAALQKNTYVEYYDGQRDVNQKKGMAVLKKLIASGRGNYNCYQNYFTFLESESEFSKDYTLYLQEFNAYFNTYFLSENKSPIEKLDEMYEKLEVSAMDYNNWTSFKNFESNQCNSLAWKVVVSPANSSYLKQAIVWSEFSLMVDKNNLYYLDTLAQLYFKDGQKEKAITTQTLAVNLIGNEVEEQTAIEMRETLVKMKNGTY